MLQRNYLNAIETLNKYQNGKPSLAACDKLPAMIQYLLKCGITLEKLDTVPIIHVTGTHGKGSTCCYVESVLLNHGYKTGFYSSPHLLEVRERIRIGGKPISKSAFSDNFWEVYDMLDKQKENDEDMPFYFPLLTIVAFHVFLKYSVDVAIIEVGIGGEFDCTNVIRTPVAVGITPISLDHTALLGTSKESIAWQKGGIMKTGSVAFTVPQTESVLTVLEARSEEKNCPLTVVGKDRYAIEGGSRVSGRVKETVGSLTIALSEAYVKKRNESFSLDTAIRSIEKARWPGRFDVRKINNIRFFLDSAHTQGSIKTAAKWYLEETTNSTRHKVLVFNLTGKRDPEIFLKELLVCEFNTALFIPNVGDENDTADTVNVKLTTDTQLVLCEEYKEKWSELQEKSGKSASVAEVFPSFSSALQFLGDTKEYDVLVTGSLYLVGAALSVLDPTLDGMLPNDE